MLIPVWFYFLVRQQKSSRSSHEANTWFEKPALRPLWLFLGFGFLVVILSTQSRGGLLASSTVVLLSTFIYLLGMKSEIGLPPATGDHRAAGPVRLCGADFGRARGRCLAPAEDHAGSGCESARSLCHLYLRGGQGLLALGQRTRQFRIRLSTLSGPAVERIRAACPQRLSAAAARARRACGDRRSRVGSVAAAPGRAADPALPAWQAPDQRPSPCACLPASACSPCCCTAGSSSTCTSRRWR